MSSSRSMGREMGTALAVLALYLLTVLAPLHQARATQLDFAALGYPTIQTGWVLCTAGTDHDDGQSLAAKCPAAGIAKQQLMAPAPIMIGLRPIALGRTVAFASAPQHRPAPHFNPAAPPHAPPALA